MDDHYEFGVNGAKQLCVADALLLIKSALNPTVLLLVVNV